MTDAFVIDNCILSSFCFADWFDAITFWKSDYDLLVTRRVWEDEFVSHHDQVQPDWLSIRSVDLSSIQVQASGQLSKKDWSCIGLAEEYDGNAAVITNDYRLKTTAEKRVLRGIWGTRFAIDTYERCGIPVDVYESGLPQYLEDVLLPPEAQKALKEAEKI
ncbi:hypothetical protein E6P09_11080 [Haloferax mediterranei ATCC 33500]|uniref:PIN domain-containing protein n=1 Tax=Haloferax mediterranei (strain ATCC 33500 / DSM 1411 / JCM 8866 / NBRC 14739 / NCIMB 2177 / R-4) TaxID=523841 RepID=I3R505_HALMT|nr:hypothetical protein [Haloferax mediterranei]AFK19315.1 hypothetical protein HFX_1609 [Haloferax mediterranei ATCC 33500]AHZ21329.1 hypothetical protein BM92_01070 [Haloferax mediterranei ATCC 33500]EMA04496.1 hypothetical protein C439_02437 [Haloferax mediterranei ATCC 33500]MDX5989419.1 hypothetical protein [Haloferax mediterranei ATCC 33500]QCQ75783.1 hypothetical protein E6P09_11080 [Haloferax mediterranei ATCC 33500]